MPLNEWWYENMYKWCHESKINYTFVNLKATKISKRFVFVLVTCPRRLPEEWPEACGSLTAVGAGTKHGFGTDPIRNPTIWLVESRNQVNLFAYRGKIPNLKRCKKYAYQQKYAYQLKCIVKQPGDILFWGIIFGIRNVLKLLRNEVNEMLIITTNYLWYNEPAESLAPLSEMQDNIQFCCMCKTDIWRDITVHPNIPRYIHRYIQRCIHTCTHSYTPYRYIHTYTQRHIHTHLWKTNETFFDATFLSFTFCSLF